MDTDNNKPKTPPISDMVGDLVVSAATVLAHSAATAVVGKVKKAAKRASPKKAIAKKAKTVARKAKKAARKVMPKKASKSKKARKSNKTGKSKARSAKKSRAKKKAKR